MITFLLEPDQVLNLKRRSRVVKGYLRLEQMSTMHLDSIYVQLPETHFTLFEVNG